MLAPEGDQVEFKCTIPNILRDFSRLGYWQILFCSDAAYIESLFQALDPQVTRPFTPATATQHSLGIIHSLQLKGAPIQEIREAELLQKRHFQPSKLRFYIFYCNRKSERSI